jgi:DUF1365 family protein
MTLRSCLYLGSVMHRRLRPTLHHFRYRAFWTLLDLDELPTLASRLRLFSLNRFNMFALYDADHGDGSPTPLRVQVERHLSDAGIDIAGGPIRLFCMPRTLGYCFNPLSIFFCYRPCGELAAIIYQVHNTFGERHAYVAAVGVETDTVRQSCEKALYVSPFMDMDMTYRFRLKPPATRFALSIGATRRGQSVLSASVTASRRQLCDSALLRAFLAIPLVTAKVTLAIHWEAARLWLKGMRLRDRPPSPVHGVTLAAPSRKPRVNSHAL